jgi:pyruvate dehydrogenase E2 component (dihydrolipoamide acetyltransferase)
MAFEITFPRLGWDMTEGVLSSWLKGEGDLVKSGEMLFAVESDKAVQEVEALDTGYLYLLPGGPRVGDKVAVGTVLGFLVPAEERARFQVPGQPAEVGPAPTAQPVAAPAPAAVGEAAGHGESRPRRKYISPYARKLAEGLGLDWRKVAGSGRAGRIMAKDVQAAAAAAREAAKPATLVFTSSAPLPAAEVRTALTTIRRKIAEHMAYSAHTAAPVTLTTEVDATEMVALRRALKDDVAARGLPVPSYNDLLAKLVAQALMEQPAVNARLEGNEIIQPASVNVAIAVDTDRGLIVPVVRDVQAKALRQIARESAALIEKTRRGTVGYEDLQGATFTITNLGMFGIDAFTPIIDLPQCAILGVGRIVPKQVVVDAEAGRVAIRQRVILSLTFDHRLIDGAQGARFLQRVRQFVESPYLWLVG